MECVPFKVRELVGGEAVYFEFERALGNAICAGIFSRSRGGQVGGGEHAVSMRCISRFFWIPFGIGGSGSGQIPREFAEERVRATNWPVSGANISQIAALLTRGRWVRF